MCGVEEATDQRKIDKRINFQFFGFLKQNRIETKNNGNIEYPIHRYQ